METSSQDEQGYAYLLTKGFFFYISPSQLPYTTTQERLISAAPRYDTIIIFLKAQIV